MNPKKDLTAGEGRMVKEIRRLVLNFFEGNEEKTGAWFTSANPLLGGISPDKMISMGREDRLMRFVQTQLAENEAPRTE